MLLKWLDGTDGREQWLDRAGDWGGILTVAGWPVSGAERMRASQHAPHMATPCPPLARFLEKQGKQTFLALNILTDVCILGGWRGGMLKFFSSVKLERQLNPLSLDPRGAM